MNLLFSAANMVARMLFDNQSLVFTTTCGPDDQFSSPKQIRWSAALGKLLVAANATSPYSFHQRNADLSFSSKFTFGIGPVAVDSDSNNIFYAISSAIRKYDFAQTSYSAVVITNIRMIDASGDPDHIYVTSNSAADGHGVRKVRKSDMTVVASLLATGSGDGQFNNPLGVFYYNNLVYVADAGNSRLQVLNASDLSFNSKHSLIGSGLLDLCTNGANWFIQYGTAIYKYDMLFTDATKTSVAAVGYSITLIPDQSDGNGATLAITDTTNSHLARYKCSDLSLINEVGSSGDGTASLFDPAITGSACIYVTDEGDVFTAASGSAPSKNGFTGIFFRNYGPHRVICKPVGGLAAVTGINCLSDLVTGQVKNLSKTKQSAAFVAYDNPSMVINLADCAGWSVTTFWAHAVLTLPPVIVGTLAQIPRTVTDLRLNTTVITGALSDIPTGAQTVWLFSTRASPASIAHLVNIRDIRIYSMGWLTVGVDTVIDSAWGARMSYTYMTGPSMQIGGTNQSPTGNYIAPSEGADWHQDGATWIPLTTKAKTYDLVNNVNSEARPAWVISFTV